MFRTRNGWHGNHIVHVTLSLSQVSRCAVAASADARDADVTREDATWRYGHHQQGCSDVDLEIAKFSLSDSSSSSFPPLSSCRSSTTTNLFGKSSCSSHDKSLMGSCSSASPNPEDLLYDLTTEDSLGTPPIGGAALLCGDSMDEGQGEMENVLVEVREGEREGEQGPKENNDFGLV